MKRIFVILVIVIALLFTACGNNSGIKQSETSLTEQEVSEEVRTVQRKIAKALESKPSYGDLVEIKEIYGELLHSEQEQITDYDKIEEMMELSPETVACIFAINKLKDQLKNPSSLEVLSASCCKDPISEDVIYIKLEYSAENDLGGSVEDEYYCIVNVPIKDTNNNWSCKLEDLFQSTYNLELINSVLGSTTGISSQEMAKDDYDNYSDDAIEISVGQIMDNLDLSIKEIVDNES